MRSVIVVSLLLAACSGDVRSASTRNTTVRDAGTCGTSSGGQVAVVTGGSESSGGRPATAGSTGTGGRYVPVCRDRTTQGCPCPSGAIGFQVCRSGQWARCTCEVGGQPGWDGSAPVCSGATGQPCVCSGGGVGFQLCMPDGQWGACACAPIGHPVGTGGAPNFNVCGDGIISGAEQCDGQNIPHTCAIVSMGACRGGYLICTATCIYDYSACICSPVTDAGAGF